MESPLSFEIEQEYNKLKDLIEKVPTDLRDKKAIAMQDKLISVNDIIAYQIGWGKCVISWYEAGLRGEMPKMPGEGFTSWDYSSIANHFYQKYSRDNARVFHNVVMQILFIVEKEYQNKRLDQVGVWLWCTLRSGKMWPLSKWIRINTCAPYKRASGLLRKFLKTYLTSN